MQRRTLAGLVPAFVLMAACDIPTSMPIWDMTWNVPAKSTTISASSFLPASVTLPAGSSAFNVSAAAATVSTPLSTYCSCTINATVPKPAFSGTSVATSAFPSGVASATVAAGSVVDVQITNNTGFDLLNPAGYNGTDARSMTITISNGSTTLGTLTLNGSTGNTVPAGVTTRQVALTAGSTLSSASPITITTTVVSPAGSTPVALNTANTIDIRGTPTVLVSTATVALTSTSVNSTTALDLQDIDESIRKRVNSGKIFLTVTNPFAASGTLTLNFKEGSTTLVTKTLTLAASSTAAVQTLSFTGAELQSILGRSITLEYTGAVAGSSVTVTPTQAVTIGTRLELNVNTKAQQ
jgi:hypothetical protein